ncbi:MAG: hypothetical protein IKE23_09775, partial [Exiguobacterium sp.]|nr:hypothetical protein [Exiguobacterium sp.]
MANWDKMTESKFRAVKLLLKGGASVKEAAEYMQMSTATVYIINTAENFEEYTAIRVARDSKRAAAIKAKKDEPKPAPDTAPATASACRLACTDGNGSVATSCSEALSVADVWARAA